MVEVRWVAYGREAGEGLRAALAETKAGDALRPVTVVVPSNTVGVSARRALGSGVWGPVAGDGSGIAAVTFLTVYRLADLLGAPVLAGQGRRPVSTPVVAAAIRRALAAEPGVFRRVADHPATESALVEAYRELRNLPAEALDRLAAGSDQAASVVRLHRAARAALAPDWYDEQDLAEAAVRALASGHDGAGGPLIVYLPERLSLPAARLLAAACRHRGGLVLAGTTGDQAADADVTATVELLGGTPAAPPAAGGPLGMVEPGRTEIVTASDADEEVRAAVRAVVDAARSGIPLDRIAVLHAAARPYGRLLHEHLGAAGVPCNGSAVAPLTARLSGRTLLGLLRLPDGGFRREDVFAWLGGARLHRGGRRLPVAAWERASRRAGVVAGVRQWDDRLSGFAARCRAEADEVAADPDGTAGRGDRLRRQADDSDSLRAFVLGLAAALDAQRQPGRGWADMADWARAEISELLGPPAARAGWPMVEQRAAERVERALDRLARLDPVEANPGFDVFARTLELELEADLGRTGRIGEGVFVGSLAMGLGLDLEVAVVVGMAEGLLPRPVRDDPLLPDRDRERAGTGLPLHRDDPHRQRRQLLGALAGARRHLLLFPRGDLRRSSERLPSRWLLEVAGRLAGRPLWSQDLLAASGSWIRQIASHDDGLRTCPDPATGQEYRLRTLMAAGPSDRSLGDPVLEAGQAVVTGRRSDEFTRFDGNLAGLAVPSPVDGVTSATRLESWARCPFAYLLGEILGVEPVENPEERLRITALDRGSLVHDVLERFMKEVLARPGGPPDPDERWSEQDHARLAAIAGAVAADYETRGRTGRAIFWDRDRGRMVRQLQQLLRFDDARRSLGRSRPLAAELPFGMPRSRLESVGLPLADGRSVRFRGLADRVDACDDGGVTVIDYKTGRPDSYRRLSEDDPDAGGTRLQLAVYGLAARALRGDVDAPVRAEYWFVSPKNGVPEPIGYEVTDAVLGRVSSTVSKMVGAIEAGVFPSHPTATSSSPWVECPFCDPDALGVVDLVRQLESKGRDPRVAAYLALVGAGGERADA